MPETEYHVVIACPPEWGESTANILAARLVVTELPESVRVYVWKLEDGRIVEQTVVQEVDDDAV